MWELEAHSKSLQLTTIHTGHEIKMLTVTFHNRPQIIPLCMHIKYILLAYLCILFAYFVHILCIFQHICAFLCIFMHISAYSLHIKYIFLAYLCIFSAYIMHILTYLGIFSESAYFLHLCTSSTLAYLMPSWSFHNADWNLSFSPFFVSLTAFFLQLTSAFRLFRHVADMALTTMCTCVQIKLLQHVTRQPFACAPTPRIYIELFTSAHSKQSELPCMPLHACMFHSLCWRPSARSRIVLPQASICEVADSAAPSVHLRGRG